MTLSFVNVFFLLVLLIAPLNLSFAKKCVFSQKYEVHVINKLPANSSKLRLHCASKNTEIGDQILPINGDLNWSFCESFLDTTLYFCHFWWGPKDKSFDVFDDPTYCVKNGKNPNVLKYCKWEVREDGFYLEQYNARTSTYYMEKLEQW
ncbi:hypothetical protein EJD97_010781 [Solanum chilense]|uniref:S-protein homolog n=1 Tax=Solanum chilense TaxID=4083 RepID=A0A6N2BKI8_SOLCI|nr:hypothetical protein EJD97_010781 [Solanum chilense]